MFKNVVGSILIAASLASPLYAGAKDKRLEIHWVDVEGGAATLIVTPAGESVLIDTGNPGPRDASRIVKMAAHAGVNRIDHLIVTHYHRDHYGGANTLATLIPIGTVYDNGKFESMPDNPGKAYFEFKCRRRVIAQPGMSVKLRSAEGAAPISLRCLGTRRQFIATPQGAADNQTNCANHQPKKRDGSDNANSVVMLLDFGDFRFYDAGDLTWNQEKKLVCPENKIGEVDVYQVTHHGLDSSNNPVVLQTIKPTVAIMNNGVTKGCAPAVFADLKATKSLRAIYQLHKNHRPDGSVNNVADEFIANLKKDACDGNHVTLSVAPDGASYVVGVPARGHSATYQTRKK